MNLIWVMGGGALGAGLRYHIGLWFQGVAMLPWFMATLSVNLIGSFLMGVAFGYFAMRPENHPVAALVMSGFLGGFTTFSAFSLQISRMLSDGAIITAMGYILASIVLGVLAIYAGMAVIK